MNIRKISASLLAAVLLASVSLAGCTAQQEAEDDAATMESVDGTVDY